MKSTLWIALMAVVISPAAAQDSAEKPKEEKKICRAQGAKTGSILSQKRVCHTKQEWTAIDEANARDTERALEARRANTMSSGR